MKHPKQRLLALLIVFLGACVSPWWNRPADAQLTLGTYYDALFYDSRAKRLEDKKKLDDAGFRRLASVFTADDAPILDACQAAGTKVVFAGNATSPEQTKAYLAKYPCIDALHIQDDADLAPGGPAALAAKREAARTLIASVNPPRAILTYASFGKGAKPEQWANTADVAHLQLYIYKEGTLRKWYWDYVLAWRAAHQGKLWVGPYLGKNATPFFALFPKQGLPDPVWTASEYTPVAYNEAACWAALCAGADDLLFYSAFAINSGYPQHYYRISERWDLLPGYKALLARIRKYEPYFAGKRETFDKGQLVGATWTLPGGEKLTVTVDTLEALPRVDFLETKPVPTPTAKVTVLPAGVTITAPAGVEFATAP